MFTYRSIYVMINIHIKTRRVSPLVADLPLWNIITRKNPPICNPPLYITITFEPNMQLKNLSEFKIAHTKEDRVELFNFKDKNGQKSLIQI